MTIVDAHLLRMKRNKLCAFFAQFFRCLNLWYFKCLLLLAKSNDWNIKCLCPLRNKQPWVIKYLYSLNFVVSQRLCLWFYLKLTIPFFLSLDIYFNSSYASVSSLSFKEVVGEILLNLCVRSCTSWFAMCQYASA